MACMGVNRTHRQIVNRKRFRKRISEMRKMGLGPTITVTFSLPSRNECTEEPPRFGRPCDVGFVDAPSPWRRVVASGKEMEGKCEHLLTSDR